MAKLSVLVLYNAPVLARDHPDAEAEHSVIEIADLMNEILTEAGYRVGRLSLGGDPAVLWGELQARTPDVVFNLFEGNPDNTETESFVAGLLDWAGVPYTGSPFAAMSLARAKHTTKHLLKGAGLPTADFLVVNELPMPACALKYPVFVKPAKQDASVGVDQGSVCVNPLQLEQRVTYVLKTYGAPVLVEEFIDGREFNVAVIELPELQSLRPTEVLFPNQTPDAWPILTYDGKWNPDSPDYDSAPTTMADNLPRGAMRKLGILAEKAYRLIGCRDYARVDFRMNEAGKLFILEVNPNPEISEHAGFAGSLGPPQLTYREFILKVVQQALSRKHAPKPTFAPTRPTTMA